MQQARRWRPRHPTAWRTVMVRWLLICALLLTLEPSAARPTFIAQAQEQPAAETAAPGEAEAVTEDEAVAEDEAEAVADEAATEPGSVEDSAEAPAETAPDAAPTDDAGESQSAAVPPDAAVGEQARPSVAPAESDPSETSPAGRAAAQRVADADSCPAELGRAKSASFKPEDRLVMTYFYYWYDQDSLRDPAMTQHPPAEPALDWRSVEWHERQLADMASAGIDVALAVYWGDTDRWSVEALQPMVEARERLLATGLRPPAIGLFFDTNMYALILPDQPELADLTTDEGQAMLAHQVGVFLDQVPPCHRARIDDRVLAFFWRADTEDGDHFTFDDRTFAGLNDQIERRYGERLHFALEQSWVESARRLDTEVGAADIYGWGAALNGPRFNGRTVAIGPGYDDRQIDGRPGYLRERVDGATYSHDLRSAVMSGANWLLLETWNELWEGTAIAETEETGRTYLGITARYTALFHQLGAERARDGWFDLGSGHNAYLRRLADAPVEQGTSTEEAGRFGARPFPEDDGSGYFHFALDRRLGLSEGQALTVWVEYFDAEDGSFTLEYDSLDPAAPDDGAYKVAEDVAFLGTGRWRVYRFDLPDASLRARQYDGVGNFRIHDRPGSDGKLHTFGRVMVTAAPAARPVPIGPESLSFVEPGAQQPVSLRWSEVAEAAGYLVTVQPFSIVDSTMYAHGFSSEERRRCAGEADLAIGQLSRGLALQPACELRLPSNLDEGIYRWQVQPLDESGSARGEPSDWAYFVVARR